MRKRFATLALAALTLTGCAGTRLLPNVQTGKCYTLESNDFTYLSLFAGMGAAVDGWRCEGLAVGDAYRTEESRSDVKIAAPVRAPVAAPPTKSATTTWATGE